jgi:cell wall assembly regulator SMI1
VPHDPLAVLERIRASELADQDGDQIVPEFGPPLSSDEILELRAEIGMPLPRELEAVLAETRSIDGMEQIDFTGRTMDVELSEISPSGLPIATDGFGNFWFLDLTPDDADTVPVFFHCHDPPVVVYQGPSLGDFLRELVRLYEPPHESAVRDVHDEAVFDVFRTNPGVIDHAAALAGDDELRAFATSIDETFELVDLRTPRIGAGFSWGRYGPRTEIRRFGYSRLFAYARPEKKPGLLSRFLGR